jgi:hypothetical protein
MNGVSNGSPLLFHRFRRDHQLRLFFSAAQRAQGGKPAWLRSGHDLSGIVAILDEALHHARETLRERNLEWPEDHPDDSDRKLEKFLAEMICWFRLLEGLSPGGDDPRPPLRGLVESRLRLGQQLFHASRHPMAPSFARP